MKHAVLVVPVASAKKPATTIPFFPAHGARIVIVMSSTRNHQNDVERGTEGESGMFSPFSLRPDRRTIKETQESLRR